MFATFEEFVQKYSKKRVMNITTALDASPADAYDSAARRDIVENALTSATDEIQGFATIPDPTPQIVRGWCMILAWRNLAEGSGSSSNYTEIDKEASDRVREDLIRCKDGGMLWETKADQNIPSGPVPDMLPAIVSVTVLSSTSQYALERD